MADDGSQQRKPDFKTAIQDAKALVTVLAMEAHSVLGRRTARVLGVLVLFAAVVGLLDLYIAPTNPEQKQALVVTLAQILGGAALLSGLYFTWRTLQVNREGQITERFTRAIDQLGKVDNEGNKLFEIRVGGIYALGRIARESAEDHWPIMEILTAYVRQHAAVEKTKEDSRGESETADVPTPDPDIQAIMTVLRKRTHSLHHGEPEPLNLHATNLSGVNLSGVNLSGVNLSGANLSGANLSGANLFGGTSADLSDTDLSDADLSDANLSWAILSDANLASADLYRTNLTAAGPTRTNFSGAQLSDANLSYARLLSANLKSATLFRADFLRANLSNADLSAASLSEAKNLTQEQLEQANGNEFTYLPDNLMHPTHWPVTVQQIVGEVED